MKSLRLISATLLLFGMMLSSCVQQEQTAKTADRPPNFLIILADDLGHDDLAVHGNPVFKTPHLDQLHDASLRFSQFTVNSVCAPSRASLLTGRTFLRTGVSHVHGGKDYINLNETLISQALRERGYATAMWGKWHSGYTDGYQPWQRGFDEAYMADLYKHNRPAGSFNGSRVTHEGWADQVSVDYAIDFMERHQDKPFLGFVSLLAPHAPIAAPEEFVRPYLEEGLSPNFARLGGMISFMDAQIGRLLTALDALQLSENTVVLFLSDNGPQIMTNFLTPEERDIRYAANRRGHKGSILENGVKSPLFIRWKGKLTPQTIANPADITDIFPTLLALSGSPAASDSSLDGVSLAALFMKPETTPEAKPIFNWVHVGWVPDDSIPYTPKGIMKEYNPVAKDEIGTADQIMSIRLGDYKLILNEGKNGLNPQVKDQWSLYDVAHDPTETSQIEDEAMEGTLRTMLEDYFEDIKASPNAFAVPVFRVGYSRDSADKVAAAAPVGISENLHNTLMVLTNWQQKGDFATYSIDCHHEADFTLGVIADDATSAEFEISVGEGQTLIANTLQSTDKFTLPKGKHEVRVSLLNDLPVPVGLRALMFYPEK